LAKILKQAQRDFSDDRITYRNIGNETYQLEVARKTFEKQKPSGVLQGLRKVSETKSAVRFWTPEIQDLAPKLRELQARYSVRGSTPLSTTELNTHTQKHKAGGSDV
jgi:hypothetical protein